MSEKNDLEILARGLCVVDGNVLLCHTRGADNTYLPGGHLEFEESAKDALEREIREEMGVSSSAGRFYGAVEHTFIQKGKRHCELNLVFELIIPALSWSEIPKSCEDYIDFRWVTVDKLADAHLEPAALINLIPRWLDGPVTPEAWASNY